MGEVVKLPTGRKRTQDTNHRTANDEPPSLFEKAVSGAKRFAIDALCITTGNLFGIAGRLLWLVRRPISLGLTFGAVSMLVVFVIQAANGWPAPKLVVLSAGGLTVFLAASAGYDRLARAFFHIENRLKGE
ncbi:TPA: hypothetical protein ACNIM8_005905 [Pseudomonas aeruginosa]